MRSTLRNISVLATPEAVEALSRADQLSYAGLDNYSLAHCSDLQHLKRTSVIKNDIQGNEDPLYCTRRLCESGQDDTVMLNLMIRGFVTSVDIFPLSKHDGVRSASHLSQRIEICAPNSNSNFVRALEGMKNIHALFSAECPPRSLGPWMPPAPQSGLLRVDFVTPYLSSDENLPLAEFDSSHDPDGIFQAILRKSQNKYFTEDNKVEYLRMETEDNIHIVKPMPPLHIHPGQLVELTVGFLVAPTGKAKLALKRRFSTVCVLETTFQAEFNSSVSRLPPPAGRATVQRFSPYEKRGGKGVAMDEDK